MTKLTTMPLKALIQQYPLTKSQQSVVLDFIEGHGVQFPDRAKQVLMIPDAVDLFYCMAKSRDSAYTVEDIMQWTTTDELPSAEKNFVRVIIMKSDDYSADMPIQVIIECTDDGQEMAKRCFIEARWADELHEGMKRHVQQLREHAAQSLQLATDTYDKAFSLQAWL